MSNTVIKTRNYQVRHDHHDDDDDSQYDGRI